MASFSNALAEYQHKLQNGTSSRLHIFDNPIAERQSDGAHSMVTKQGKDEVHRLEDRLKAIGSEPEHTVKFVLEMRIEVRGSNLRYVRRLGKLNQECQMRKEGSYGGEELDEESSGRWVLQRGLPNSIEVLDTLKEAGVRVYRRVGEL